jgi:hypothetical protein
VRAAAADRVSPGQSELGLAEVIVAADGDPYPALLRRRLAKVEQRFRNFDLVACWTLQWGSNDLEATLISIKSWLILLLAKKYLC